MSGRLTQKHTPLRDRMIVLNAFRHHRKTHEDECIKLRGVTDRAQRLSASSEDSLIPLTTLTHEHQSCAQRLSASSEDSPALTFPLEEVPAVLNAFRHHRKTHFTCGLRFSPVSNCAQRLSASSEDSP